jgi:N6-adenosine-specific RNA methylase IME4
VTGKKTATVEAPDTKPSQVENRLADLGASVVRRCARLHDAEEAVLDERIGIGGELQEAWTLLAGNKKAFHRWLTRSGWKYSQPTAWYHRMLAEHEADVRRVFKTQGMNKPLNYKAVVDLVRKAPEYLDAVCAGDKEVEDALRLHKRHERDERYGRTRTEAEDLALFGTYAVVLADPPWRWDDTLSPGRSVEGRYPTMDIEAVKELKIPAADDSAVLFLWSPGPMLEAALEVINAWDFTYRTQAVWVKDKVGLGNYFRLRHENLLLATRGDLPTPSPEARPDSVIEAPRGEHSAKPDAVYERIEQMYPGLPKLELFARTEREGWTAWGDQMTGVD